jgi:AcrR family transcriptional regulator
MAATLFASRGYIGTSLKDVADACGILPGSLYHHFESKEAIVIELVERYQAELDQLGRDALDEVGANRVEAIDGQILRLGTSIARTALRHRAALQLTLYEPPAGASERLVELSRRTPTAVEAAMKEILVRARASGYIKPGIDTATLAERICDIMTHVGLGHALGNSPAEQVAKTVCYILLYGVTTDPPLDSDLDRSDAMLVAQAAVETWKTIEEGEGDERAALLRLVARTEFARRGYEATTIRDIASAAGIGTGSVYRFIESKEALLESIMKSYHTRLSQAYEAVMASKSSTVEKLDALSWLNINVQEQFNEEFQIQRAWLREIPPNAARFGTFHQRRLKQLRRLIAEGLRGGELRVGQTSTTIPPITVIALCVRDLIWLSVEIVGRKGRRASLEHSRATMLRGAVAQRSLSVAASG